ncbi:hypothetical protein GALMADRAFT_209311 [Galerina marginata CBS 339.88]|uniref:Uncharacterized protein n=1 Tax=Galerina marginata (strain CBS 339.88) TaxID=685588 RepID=A0A067T9G9_GALM3|nr:hypothetical protein GALMADRAFT_209311 [Galerina marginata CBS 339.88]
MPESVGSRELSSSESLKALLLALGLTDSESITEQFKPIERTIVATPNFIQKEFLVPQRPLTPFSKLDISIADENQILAQDFCSDFGNYTDLEEECDADSEPLSPGPIESFSPSGIHQDITQKTKLRISSFGSTPTADHIYIKAAHNASIIMLRTSRDIKFADLKRRLYDKFVNQENILLSHTFSVVLALPPSTNPGCRRMSLASCTEMRFIDRESDWRKIITANDGNKITLRILDTPP